MAGHFEINKKINILITGINGVLGRIIAQNLCNNNNFFIIGTDSHDKLLVDLPVAYYPCNLERVEEVLMLAETITKEYKGIHVLINNAAIKDFDNFDLYPPSRIVSTIHVNLLAPMVLTNHFFRFMKTEKFGKIIHISSPSAFEYYEKGWLYCTTKAAVAGLPNYTGDETFRSGITMHTIYPQSFIKRNGIQLIGYHYITGKVAKYITGIIRGDKKKKWYVAGSFLFTLKINILNWLRYV